jgi:hypothetical protein
LNLLILLDFCRYPNSSPVWPWVNGAPAPGSNNLFTLWIEYGGPIEILLLPAYTAMYGTR